MRLVSGRNVASTRKFPLPEFAGSGTLSILCMHGHQTSVADCLGPFGVIFSESRPGDHHGDDDRLISWSLKSTADLHAFRQPLGHPASPASPSPGWQTQRHLLQLPTYVWDEVRWSHLAQADHHPRTRPSARVEKSTEADAANSFACTCKNTVHSASGEIATIGVSAMTTGSRPKRSIAYLGLRIGDGKSHRGRGGSCNHVNSLF